ncbi:hypothetical protein AVEN_131296-1 [Araneus ventricosus]|uniref:Uncharacterized protein n=1 Tax=Araneus ventricosus TaxID=182803 RepID=A0A4Y2HF66_ARAVE|nr:hypothetical protein AVEN_131296-1 [Araneus ventricosus]
MALSLKFKLVDKMFLDHAYNRAIRDHFLVQSSLAHIVLDNMAMIDDEKLNIHNLLRNFLTEPLSMEKIDADTTVKLLQNRMTHELEAKNKDGPTAALWIQYFYMVSIAKDYISAERCGDWNGHLKCVARIIPYFHASGHTLYAKSSHIYLQDMLNLKDIFTSEEHQKFIEDGFFTMRRCNIYWSGTWSDMLIEQTLMRQMKSSGGLTREQGVSKE